MKPVIIISTYPNKKSITKISNEFVKNKIIACVNISKISSIYSWNGKVENTSEYLAIFKTTTQNKKLLKKKIKDFELFQVCQYDPLLGLIPIEISDIYPAAHHETSRINFEPNEFPTFEKTWNDFFSNNIFSEIHYDKEDKFLKYFAKNLPKEIKKKSFV